MRLFPIHILVADNRLRRIHAGDMQALSVNQVGCLIVHPDGRNVVRDDGPDLIEQFLTLGSIQFLGCLGQQSLQFGVVIAGEVLAEPSAK